MKKVIHSYCEFLKIYLPNEWKKQFPKDAEKEKMDKQVKEMIEIAKNAFK